MIVAFLIHTVNEQLRYVFDVIFCLIYSETSVCATYMMSSLMEKLPHVFFGHIVLNVAHVRFFDEGFAGTDFVEQLRQI